MSASEFLHCKPAALLETVGGDRNTFMLLVDIYRRDTAEKLAAMQRAIKQGDWEQFAFNTHALKGTVGPTGADILLDDLVRLEAQARSTRTACDAAALAGIERQLGEIRQELERFAAML